MQARAAARVSPEIWQDDFLGFVPNLDIVPKDTRAGRIKLRPNHIQRTFEGARTGRDIVLKPRQIGFTTWELARDVWHFVTRRGACVVIVVQSSADHAPLKSVSGKLRVMFESLQALGITLDFDAESTSEWSLSARDARLRIVEAGGSEAAADKKGRGGTITRLHVTELAFFEFAEQTLNALLETVPDAETGSEVTIESTANGAAGEFFERYTQAKAGTSGYRAHFFPWLMQEEYASTLEPDEVVEPQDARETALIERHGATPQQIKWYRRKLGDKKGNTDLFDQEYPVDEETCWIVSGRLFFDRERTKELIDRATPPLETRELAGGVLRVWSKPERGAEYVVTADPSEGTGGDPGAALVHDRSSGAHVATLHGQFPPWQFGQRLAALGHEYNDAVIVVERNNHGHAVLQSLEHLPGSSATEREYRYPSIYFASDSKLGWYSTSITRPAALDALDGAHRDGEWTSPDREVLAEMLTFVVADGKPQAAIGAHDDLVMASAIAHDVLTKSIVRQDEHSFDTEHFDEAPLGL